MTYFTKIEIKDIDQVPEDCIVIIEKQVSFTSQHEIYLQHPHYMNATALYEVEIQDINLYVLKQLIDLQPKKGLYLKFDHDFVLTPEKAKLLGYEMAWNNDFVWILDLNLLTLKHNEYLLSWLNTCSYIVLKTSGYFQYRKEKIEQGDILKYLPYSDMDFDKINEMYTQYLKYFNEVQILIQFPTCALKKDVSISRKSALLKKDKECFVDHREDVLRKKSLGINYLIENLDFDYHPIHPESVYQILKGSDPQPIFSTFLIPRKKSKTNTKIDMQTSNQEDSYKTNPSEYIQIFEME